MRKFLSIFLFSNIFALIIQGQRTLQVVNEPFDHFGISATSTDGEVLIAMQSDQYLIKYNDFSLSRYNYPTVAGSRLSYSQSNPLVTFRSLTYIILNGGGNSFLFTFNGGSFSRITIPGNIISNAIVYSDNLYVLSRDRSLVKLFRYNGATTVEVPFAYLPVGGFYHLHVEDNSLFMEASNFPGALHFVVKRYNGASVFTYPNFEFPEGIKKILPVPGTPRAYFVLNGFGRRIFYFNGSSIVRLFESPGADNVEATVFRGNLYFLTTTRSPFTRSVLRRAEGSTITEIPFPAGSSISEPTELIVYNDALLLQVWDETNSKIVSYDGAAFSDLFHISGTHFAYGRLFLRNEKLMINPGWGSSNTAYEYDGSSFTSISYPGDHRLTDYLGETNCNHLWLMDYVEFEGSDVLSLVSLVRESKECPPPPPPPVLVIPRFFYPFDRFVSIYSVREERECWSDIVVDWHIDPICPVPEICPRPNFQLTFSDATGKIAWQQKFDKPITTSIPLDGKLPFKTSFSSVENVPRDLIVLDQELVQKGITRLAFRMNPQKGILQVAASTKAGTIVPLKISLLNKDGKAIWEKEFKAPFNIEITDKVNEPGELLHFSTPESQLTIREEERTNNLFTYSNPSHGTLTIDAKDKTILENAEITITNMLGQKIISKRITNQVQSRLILPPYHPGLFVISLTTKDGKVTNKIVWLK